MKKKVLAVLTALMVMSIGITANAAPSVTAGDASGNTIVVAESATSMDGVTVTGANVAAATSAEVAAVKAQVATKLSSTTVTVKKVLNITAPAGFVAGTPTTVSVTVPGIDASKPVYVMHIKADGTSELLAATVNGNTVTFTTTSFSPFAVIEATSNFNQAEHDLIIAQWRANQLAEKAAAANAAQAAAVAPGVVASPKTGE